MDSKFFLKIEKNYNLCQDIIDNIPYWEISRFVLWQYEFCVEMLDLGSQKYAKKGSLREKISTGMNIVKCWNSVNHIKGKEFDVLFIDHERRVKSGDRYVCIYTDELADFYSSVVLEHPYQNSHLRPVPTKNLVYIDSIVVRGNIYAFLQSKLLKKRYREYQRMVRERLDEPLDKILTHYKLEISKNKIYNIIVKRMLLYAKEKDLYRKILMNARPKLVVEVCHYSLHSMILNELSRELGIKTVELQHGTMHEEHIGYQYAPQQSIGQLPDYIFSFSEYWNTIIHMPNEEIKTIAVGFPYFERQLQAYPPQEKGEKKTILFISQGTIGKQLSQFAVEIYRALGNERYRYIYKLHPAEYCDWAKRLPWLAETDICVVDNSEKNLYEYFAESDIQVGVYSTAVYEGLGYGLDTYIYNVGHASVMHNLIEQGYAKMVNTVSEFTQLLDGQTQRECVESTPFWKMNALDSMLQEINKLIEVSGRQI